MESKDLLNTQLETILDKKHAKQSPMEQFARQRIPQDAAEHMKEAGRLAPCVWLSGLDGTCKLGHDPNCLTCVDYRPHESPGFLNSPVCKFETSHIYHLMHYAESDGYYRSGQTFCNRYVDELNMPLEIYDGDSPHGEDLKEYRLCKKCAMSIQRQSASK